MRFELWTSQNENYGFLFVNADEWKELVLKLKNWNFHHRNRENMGSRYTVTCLRNKFLYQKPHGKIHSLLDFSKLKLR